VTERLEATREEGERLICAAFEAARASGRSDWHRMTTAVLKNRLLSLTGREFDEARWGASSFREFVSSFPEIVTVDATAFPAVVEFRGEPTAETMAATDAGFVIASKTGMTPQQRVRPDLWNATLDYSSGRTYMWDTSNGTGTAVPVDEVVANDPRPALRTVTPEMMAAWREEFATKRAERLAPRQAQTLLRWRDEGLTSASLPSSLRGLWNAALKQHTIDMLVEWFKEQKLPVPDDLILTESSRPTHPDTERLRNLVYECVSVMTREELAALSLPAAAVLRARG
jgi:hypothetical protein